MIYTSGVVTTVYPKLQKFSSNVPSGYSLTEFSYLLTDGDKSYFLEFPYDIDEFLHPDFSPSDAMQAYWNEKIFLPLGVLSNKDAAKAEYYARVKEERGGKSMLQAALDGRGEEAGQLRLIMLTKNTSERVLSTAEWHVLKGNIGRLSGYSMVDGNMIGMLLDAMPNEMFKMFKLFSFGQVNERRIQSNLKALDTLIGNALYTKDIFRVHQLLEYKARMLEGYRKMLSSKSRDRLKKWARENTEILEKMLEDRILLIKGMQAKLKGEEAHLLQLLRLWEKASAIFEKEFVNLLREINESLVKNSLVASGAFKKFTTGEVKSSESMKKFAMDISDPSKVASLLTRNQKMGVKQKALGERKAKQGEEFQETSEESLKVDERVLKFNDENKQKVLELLAGFVDSNVPEELQEEWLENAMRLVLLEHNGDEAASLSILEECSQSEQGMLALNTLANSAIQYNKDVDNCMKAAYDRMSSALLAAIAKEYKLEGDEEKITKEFMYKVLGEQLAYLKQRDDLVSEHWERISQQGYKLVDDLSHELYARDMMLSDMDKKKEAGEVQELKEEHDVSVGVKLN